MFTLTKLALSGFGFWGISIKVLLICLCVSIVLLVSWRKKNNMFCKKCKKRVRNSASHCKNCGSAMTEDNTEIIIGISNKTRTISVLAIAFLVGMTGLSVVAFARSYNFSDYATGMYSEFHQIYTQNDSMWGVECKSALTEGSFNKTIAVNGNAPANLTIESSCDSGSLILNIKQDDRIESIDISNINSEIPYSLTKFNDVSDIKLSVEHTTAKNIKFKISWE